MNLQLVPVYKYYAEAPWRFLYSTSPDINSGWKRAGIAFYGFGQEQDGTVPVYRYAAADPTRFLLSTNPDVGQGWQNEGVAFHAFKEANTEIGTTPVNQIRAQAPWRYQYVTKYNTTPGAGWEFDNLAFNVLDAEAA